MPKTNEQQDSASLEAVLTQVKGLVYVQFNEPPCQNTVNFFEVIGVKGGDLMVAEMNQNNLYLDNCTYSAPVPHQFIDQPIQVSLEGKNIKSQGQIIGELLQRKSIDIGLDSPLFYYDTIKLDK